MSLKITVRAANLKDVSFLPHLLSDLGYPDVNSDSLSATLSEVLSNQNMTLLIAEEKNMAVGYVLFTKKPQLRLCGHSIEIDELSVSSAHRGKGIGTKLLDEVKKNRTKGRRKTDHSFHQSRTRELSQGFL